MRNYGLGVKPDQKIAMGLIWGEFDKDKMRAQAGEGGRMPRGGSPGGMPPEGGRTSGMGRGGEGGGPGHGPGGREAPKKQEVWLKVQLTTTQ